MKGFLLESQRAGGWWSDIFCSFEKLVPLARLTWNMKTYVDLICLMYM
jgi:hypothetical protein